MTESKKQAQEQLNDLLPCAFAAAIASYIEFQKSDDKSDARKFRDHYTALKSCTSHIQQLMKLGAVAHDEPEEDIEALIEKAEQEINR